MPHENHGEPLLAKITARKILEECNLDQEDIDILTLRFSYEWYHEDIGRYIGMKYRGKAYREGTIRYKIKKSLAIISEYLRSLD